MSSIPEVDQPSPATECPAVHRPHAAVLPRKRLPRTFRLHHVRSVHTAHALPTARPAFDRSRWQRSYAANLRITDTIVVCAAVVLAQVIRFDDPPLLVDSDAEYTTIYPALIAIVWLSLLVVFRARCTKIIGRGIEEYRRAVQASLWTFGTIAMAELLFKLEMARGYLAVALPAGLVGLILSRWLARRYVARRRLDGRYRSRVLAVGNIVAVADLADELTRNEKDGFRVVGACIPRTHTGTGECLLIRDEAIPIVGSDIDALETMLDECGADTVAIVGTEHLSVREIRKLTWKLESVGVDLIVSPGVMDVAVSRLTMLPIAGLPLLHIAKPQYRGAERFQKRAFDLCFASLALTAALPVLVAAAMAIKINDGGPVFYSSERVGYGGKRFRMLKLRTMVQDADKKLINLLEVNECDGQLFKMRNDPRVTPVGRVLRRFSIDELPQFINVLRREMSVVGPRPLFDLETAEEDPDSARRLLVKPGITGLWQVSGRSNLSWKDALRLDLSYVDNWSMTADIVIVGKTIRSVLAREGAY